MPRIWMSMVRSCSGPTRLVQEVVVRARLANSSSTRGMMPGCAWACTEKQAVSSAAGWTALCAGRDMGRLLDDTETTNGQDPILGEDRVANSPAGPEVAEPHHGMDGTGDSPRRQ